MKKIATFSLLTATLLSAAGIDDAFRDGNVSGTVRAAYLNNNYDGGGSDYATAVGGILRYETAPIYGFSAGVAGYISQKLNFASGDRDKDHLNSEFFTNRGKSYAYLGEAYVNYNYEDLNVRIGRQQLYNPLLDSDDIRMHPNTFEGIDITYNVNDDTELHAGFIRKWAGYDAEEADDKSKEKFRKIDNDNSKGVAYIGIDAEPLENLEISLWLYSADNMYNFLYANGVYTIDFSEDKSLSLMAQYSKMSEKKNSGINGYVYGVGAELNIEPIHFGAYYNKTFNKDDKFVTIGLGGMPYYVAMEEMILEGMGDAKAYMLSTGVDLGVIGVDGVDLSFLYGKFKSRYEDKKISEYDIVLSGEIAKNLDLEVNYAKIKDYKRGYYIDDNGDNVFGSDGYDRFLVRVSYNF